MSEKQIHLMKKTIDGIRVSIRPIKRSDLKALEWDGEYLHFRKVFKHTFNQTKTGSTQMWVVEESQNGIIGQVFVQLDGHRKNLANGSNRVYLYSIRIKPEYRNRGIGTFLMESVHTILSRKGVRYFTLNVAKENTRALNFYQDLGYQIQGHDDGVWSYIDHKGRKRSEAEPSWRMELDLLERDHI